MDSRTGRRAPRPEQRRRDAERTRQRLLDAAVTEFGSKGFAGARVGEIAARAGVNVQLISYYFGGKAGLYRALGERWRQTSRQLSASGSFAEVLARFADASLTQRDWTRLMLWDGLTDAGPDATGAAEPDYLLAAVDDVRERQRRGELPAEVEPDALLLALFAAACAPVLLPQIARRIGLDPDDPGFAERYPEQVARLAAALSRSRAG